MEEEIKNSDSRAVNYELATDMFKQYLDIKRQNPDTVLFYRLGDFYEGFFEDALIFSKELGLTLTHKDGGALGKVPMAGIPVKSANTYLSKLLKKNYKTAVCEQMENPKEVKGLVKRDVVKIITAGTITDLNLLEPSLSSWLAAVINVNNVYGLAYTDISTGEFYVTKGNLDEIISELARIKPAEVLAPAKKQKIEAWEIVPEEVPDLPERIVKMFPCTKVNPASFAEDRAVSLIKQLFNTVSLEAFGFEEYKPAFLAAGAVIDYIFETQKGAVPKFDVIKPYSISDYVSIDANTRRNLELLETSRDKSKYGSLYWALDKVKTPMGARLLKSWLTQPLKNIDEINARLDAVSELIENTQNRLQLEALTDKICDIERLAVKISSGSVNPRDFLALKDTFMLFPELKNIFGAFSCRYLSGFCAGADDLFEFSKIIERTIDEDASAAVKDGGVIKEGVDGALDCYRDLLSGGEKWLREFEEKQREETGIKNLKAGYNKNFGFFIEITKSNLQQIPLEYVRKQTLTNAERFTTEELKKHEDDVFSAQFKALETEQKIYSDFKEYSKYYIEMMKEASHFLARADVLLSFALTAMESDYTRPEITDTGELYIKDGRHPVVEKILPMGQYVPNDLKLKADVQNFEEAAQLMILTGPNMAGKSTYMRQNGIIVLMAQIGSYVPASYARIGIADKIFTRAGAADDLSLGQSTFMVEMAETAYILNSASDKSLILLDEIGRGTSTYDGVAIAWSAAEYIAKNIKARTIFSTHYHELNAMASSIGQIKNYHITLTEENGEIRFLRKVEPGGSSSSCGIQAARLAGLPNSVISRAQDLMNKMQKDNSKDLSGRKLKRDYPEAPQLTLSFGEPQ